MYSPTALDREVDIVGMQLGVPLNKLDARKVLPVAHGLLEERLMGATEDGIDLVGYHTKVPGALLAHSYCTTSSMLLCGVMWWRQHIPGCICPEQSGWGHYMGSRSLSLAARRGKREIVRKLLGATHLRLTPNEVFYPCDPRPHSCCHLAKSLYFYPYTKSRMR